MNRHYTRVSVNQLTVRNFKKMARHRQEVSISRIAEEGGVSVATVSRVMNRRVGVSEETRARIDELLRKYEYTAHYPTQRAPRIAVLCPGHDLTDYLRKAINGVFHYIQKHEMDVAIISRSNRPRTTLLQQIRDQQYSGIIVLLSEYLQNEHLELGNSELPVIFLDIQVNIEGTGFIDNDSYSGSCAATQHLLELGHRKIGYLQYQPPSLNQLQRQKGYENTMKAAGITIEKNWVIYTRKEEWSPVRGLLGLRTMQHLLEQAPEITAVMAVDDEMALGAMTAIHESGRKIPGDISIVGFDNYPETEVWYPALTTVDHPIEEAGYQAAKAIDHALKNPGQWKLPREIFPTRLIVRKSTGPASPRES